MASEQGSNQYSSRRSWGIEKCLPVKIAYGRRHKEPTLNWIPRQNQDPTRHSHKDSCSIPFNEQVPESQPNVRKGISNQPRPEISKRTTLRFADTDPLLLPPLFSQVTIRPDPISSYSETPGSTKRSQDVHKPHSVSQDHRSPRNLFLETTVQARPKATSFVKKTLTHLRRKKLLRYLQLPTSSRYPIGDGFEESERKIFNQHTKTSNFRGTVAEITHRCCLELKTGPLPPVHFIQSSLEFIRDPPDSVDDTSSYVRNGPLSHKDFDRPDDKPDPRLENMIMNELLSISAPAREPSSLSVDDNDGNESEEEKSSLEESLSTSPCDSHISFDDNDDEDHDDQDEDYEHWQLWW